MNTEQLHGFFDGLNNQGTQILEEVHLQDADDHIEIRLKKPNRAVNIFTLSKNLPRYESKMLGQSAAQQLRGR